VVPGAVMAKKVTQFERRRARGWPTIIGSWNTAAELYQRYLVPGTTSKGAEDLIHRAQLRTREKSWMLLVALELSPIWRLKKCRQDEPNANAAKTAGRGHRKYFPASDPVSAEKSVHAHRFGNPPTTVTIKITE